MYVSLYKNFPSLIYIIISILCNRKGPLRERDGINTNSICVCIWYSNVLYDCYKNGLTIKEIGSI